MSSTLSLKSRSCSLFIHSIPTFTNCVFLSLSTAMNRRVRRLSDEASYLKYLKPGALAKLRDSRISARSNRIDTKHHISLHRTHSSISSPVRPPITAQIVSDGVPCFVGRINGPRCSQRKKIVAVKSFFLPPASPVSDLPDPIIDLFSNDFLVAH